MSRLPPYGREFIPVPATGVRVVLGSSSSAWQFAKHHHCPIMVLPADANASDFRWPSDGKPALVYEIGDFNDERLDALAAELLRAGTSTVVAIREALLQKDPRVFYDAEVLDVAA